MLREQAAMGVPSLVFPLEQSPIGTQQKWLRMEVGGDFTRSSVTVEDRADAATRLDALPLWNLNYRGHMGLDLVMQVLRFEKRRHGLKIALLDHLGFIQDPDAEDERRDIQKIVRTLSHFAEHEAVTLFLVVHPSNSHVGTGDRVRMGNLRGSSAIRQDSHEVWIVEKADRTDERPHPATWIHLDAVRSDFGVSGASVCVAYDPFACTYADAWADTPAGRAGVMPVIPDEPARPWQRRRKAAAPRPTGPRRKKSKRGDDDPGTTAADYVE